MTKATPFLMFQGAKGREALDFYVATVPGSSIDTLQLFGAEGPGGYDCSGLTKKAWAAVGVHLEHYTGDQIGTGRAVSRSQLQPGDLVFYGSPVHHVGIYVGGNTMVHAPHTGDHVRMASIDRSGAITGIRRPG